ncbi:MAG: divalent-cation tolerance protein CutA [Verrucomicrobia bacterium]|nr:MAG: divalent-cation tolerance protein CutA [Verrucomicrobiota bacterium]
MVEQILIAFCTFPDLNTARKVANEIIDLRLAACGNILSPIHSIYRWKGKLESSEETLVMFKLEAKRYADFEAKLRSLHPYEVPEIISIKVESGLPDYLQWVAESCAT